MNILQLCSLFPFPLNSGGRIGIYNISKELARNGADVYLVALSSDPGQEPLAAMGTICKDILILQNHKGYRITDGIRNIFSSVPLNVQKFHSRPLFEAMKTFVGEKRIDLIHIDSLHMAYYGLGLRDLLGVPCVLREHNLEMKIMKRHSDEVRNPLERIIARVQARKIARYEPFICAQVDLCAMVSKNDEYDLLQIAPKARTTVLPAGVDTETFVPTPEIVEQSNTVVYLGSLDWPPNVAAIRWYVQKVHPRVVQSIPSARIVIYGNNPGPSVLRLHNGSTVFVHGSIEDARNALSGATVVISPLFSGSGIRIKILEAMAVGKAVVTTTIGCEGIEAARGTDFVVADTEADFAKSIVELLESAEKRRSIGRNARQAVTARYSWEHIGRKFFDTYTGLLRNYRRS